MERVVQKRMDDMGCFNIFYLKAKLNPEIRP